jgi:hypothetical protein
MLMMNINDFLTPTAWLSLVLGMGQRLEHLLVEPSCEAP